MEENIKNYCVYKHIAPNGKCYIGMTGQTPERRWQNGNGYKSQLLFYRAIEKYGWDNFEHVILEENLTQEDACKKEIYYIEKYQTTNRELGYNISLGGDLSLATPICMYSYNGELLNTFISILEASYATNIYDSSISNACNGYSKSAGGYVWRKLGDPFDKYPLPRMDEYFLIKNSSTKIKQYNMEGILLNIYNSLNDCKLKEHFSVANIYKCCIGKFNSVYGFVWRFENDSFDKYFKKYKIRQNIGESLSLIKCDNKKYSNIQVYEYDFSGTLLNIYSDVYEVAEFKNIPVEKILQCITNKSDSCYGFVYRFERDLNFENNGYKRNTRTTRIKQFDFDGNFIKLYNSIAEAEVETGATNISQCANGERHQSGGFVWRYENDDFNKYPLEHKKPKIQRLYDNMPVYEFNLNGTLNANNNSLYDLPKNKRGNITKCLKGEIKSAYGFIYSFNNIIKQYHKNTTAKKIAQYDLNTKQLIKIYNSGREAMLETGATKIYECANHKRNSSGGYAWEYVLDEKEACCESNN